MLQSVTVPFPRPARLRPTAWGNPKGDTMRQTFRIHSGGQTFRSTGRCLAGPVSNEIEIELAADPKPVGLHFPAPGPGDSCYS